MISQNPLIAVVVIVFVLYLAWIILRSLLKIAIFGFIALVVIGFAMGAHQGQQTSQTVVQMTKSWAISGANEIANLIGQNQTGKTP